MNVKYFRLLLFFGFYKIFIFLIYNYEKTGSTGKNFVDFKSGNFCPWCTKCLAGMSKKVPDTKNLLVLTSKQDDLIVAIADKIIPRSDTVSASDEQINIFIDLLLQDVFEEEVKRSFLSGLKEFDEECQLVTGKIFVELNDAERHNYLKTIDKEVMEKEYQEFVPFYYTFKQPTVRVYFSSKEGVKQKMNYLPISGAYESGRNHHTTFCNLESNWNRETRLSSASVFWGNHI